MTDLATRLAALSPVKRELLMRRLNEQSIAAARATNGAPRSKLAMASGEECEPPVTIVEEVLVQLWAEALGRDKVGTTSDFFKLGGHSLLATQLVVRISEILGVELPIIAMFAHPTIRELSEHIERGRFRQEDIPPIIPTARDQPAPLSYSQERIWFLNKLEPNSLAYNVSRAIRFFGDLKIESLERAFSELVRRHEILRTTFPSINGSAIQQVHPPREIAIPVRDLMHVAEADRFGEVERQYRSAQRRFDLEKGPLLRLDLLKFSASEYALIISEHHLLHDGWTQGILMRELIALYSAFAEGKPSPLDEPRLQYSDFARWQRQWLDSGVMERQLAYWTKQLQCVPVVELPSDRPRVARTSAGDRYPFNVPGELADRLRQLARADGATLFMVLLAAFKILLSCYAGTEDISVGTGIANRRRKESEAILGMFVNTVVLRTQPSRALTYTEFLRRVRVACVEAYANQDVPFNKVVEAVQPERSLLHPPLYQTMFSFHDSPSPRMGLPGVKVRVAPLHNRTAKFDLNVIGVPYTELHEGDDSVSRAIFMSWEYATGLFDRSTVKRMAGHYLALLESIVCNPESRIGELQMLSEVERRQLLAVGNSPAMSCPATSCLHQLFWYRAERTPEAIAVTEGGQKLTYRDLDRRSNQLAHRLRQLGVTSETVVGLCVERSVEMIVSVLGILKAGGAYLPLDPEYPTDRLRYMLHDSRAEVLVTRKSLETKLSMAGLRVLRIDVDRDNIAQYPVSRPSHVVLPDNLAYVIYTSGSTGRPKGVMVSHAAVARLLKATEEEFAFSCDDVWALFHSYAFDFSVWEMWGALAYGGRLVIVPANVSRSPGIFGALMRGEGITVLNQTPSAFTGLSRELIVDGLPLTLRLVIFGGEALSTSSLRSWFDKYGDEGPRLVNMYGITETTVHVTHRVLARKDLAGAIGSPIGKPIRDLSVHLLVDDFLLKPFGVSGELYVGGPGLARGYLNRAALTAERFVPSPFGNGERLYRSGDLARWRDHRELEYIGRIDRQVKIRGYRIELGEIETKLADHPAVRCAAVAVREDKPGDKRLVAYVVANDRGAPDAQSLRAHLKDSLPVYMIPSAYVPLNELPLTATGKLDHRALPTAELETVISRNYVEPRSPIEETIAKIWCDVLSRQRVGIHDNFFDLGGHSLLAMRVVAQVRTHLEFELPLSTLFEAPTVAELSERLLLDLAKTIAEQSADHLIK